MLSASTLSSAIYNSLPEINQVATPSTGALQALRKVFVEHGMCDSFGVAVLHRHFYLNGDEIMLHDGLVCAPITASKTTGATGHSFFLRDGQFQAYEYMHEHYSSLATASPSFLLDLSDILIKLGLQNIFALTKIDQDASLLMETCGPGRTHVCSSVTGEDSLPTQLRETQWKFEKQNIQNDGIKTTRVCTLDGEVHHGTPWYEYH